MAENVHAALAIDPDTGWPTLRAGDLSVDLIGRKVFWRGAVLPFGSNPFSLLALLMLNAGTVVDRSELQAALQASEQSGTNKLTVHLSRVRRVLVDAGVPATLKVVRNKGYTLHLAETA